MGHELAKNLIRITSRTDSDCCLSTVAVETEEMDFGSTRTALAADVDDGIAEEDLGALDSDEEYEDDPDALFADREEDSDSKSSRY